MYTMYNMCEYMHIVFMYAYACMYVCVYIVHIYMNLRIFINIPIVLIYQDRNFANNLSNSYCHSFRYHLHG